MSFTIPMCSACGGAVFRTDLGPVVIARAASEAERGSVVELGGDDGVPIIL